MQTGWARAVQQGVCIQAEKLHVLPCQSSGICDSSCSMETQGQPSFTELVTQLFCVQW